MLEILKAILFGIVEGITEWLPISSTGHMILLNELLPLGVSDEFYSMFEVVIQLGAIMAVVVLFWQKIWPFQWKDRTQPVIKKDIFIMWFQIVAACIPAAVVGLLFDDVLEKYLYNYVVVALSLIVFGIAFIVVENRNRGVRPVVTSLRQMTYKTAFIIGLFQLIAAVFPGTSRSGATIVGALMIGVSRTVAAEFTFFLAIPVMLGASLLKLVKYGFAFTGQEVWILLTGMLVAFVVSLFVLKFLMDYIKKHDFKVFGYYRIALGALVLLFFLIFR
ncbi:MAG: undecaprenyl-diphosphate phosphatase [Lachnospiraceae bacterium]|nr:undecaprenyl-diphosphate phosphatase [Lachnospiraceae bacterium]